MQGSGRAVARFVWATGRIEPSSADLERAGRLARAGLDPDAVAHVADAHRVTPQLLHSAAALRARGVTGLEAIASRAEESLRARQAQSEELLHVLARFSREASHAGVRFLAVKGTALRDRYPVASDRQMRDVDLLIAPRDGWEALRVLERVGERPRRLRLERGGARLASGVYGIAETAGNRFDVHFGFFPGCGGRPLDADVWERARTVTVDGVQVPVPCLEDSIAITAAHVSREAHVRLRDLNDVYVCVTGDEPLDWDRLVAVTRSNALTTVVHALVEGVRRHHGVGPPEAVVRSLAPALPGRLLARLLVRASGRDPDGSFGANQLFAGRFMQAAFMYPHHRRDHAAPAALARSVRDLHRLVRHGRPYRLWAGREFHDLAADERLVAVPVGDGEGGAPAEGRQIPPRDLLAHARERGVVAREVAHGVGAWNAGSDDELLVTPAGLYVQAPYSGELSAPERDRAVAAAAALREELADAGRVGGEGP